MTKIKVPAEQKDKVEFCNTAMQSDDDVLVVSDSVILHDAAYEEMKKVLYAADKHAIVLGNYIENNESLIKTARKYLPDYTRVSYVSSDCFMIKKSVLKTFGQLEKGHSYYHKINKFGFSAVVANKALYSYKDELAHSSPGDTGYDTLQRDLGTTKGTTAGGAPAFDRTTDPATRFLKLIDKEYYAKKRILFDCIIMPTHHCGTSEYQLSVFDAFYRLYKDKYEIFLYVNYEAAKFFNLSEKYENILYPDTISGVFHLGYAPNQLMYYESQVTLNKHCLKIVQTVFDIMMVRINEHFGVDVSGDVSLGMGISDGIVFISDFTKRDYLSCYANESFIAETKLKVIYPATEFATPDDKGYKLPFEKYFLLVGNSFQHKGINETLSLISNCDFNFIVHGIGKGNYLSKNIFGYPAGGLDEDFLNYIYSKSTAVIFPSLYEGFGLPITIALKNGKRVIVNNNALNNELMEHFASFKEYFLFFDRFDEIADIISSVDFSIKLPDAEYSDSWERVAKELELFFEEVLSGEVNIERLNDRFGRFNQIEPLTNAKYRKYSLFAHLFATAKEFMRIRHPKMFLFLKSVKNR